MIILPAIDIKDGTCVRLYRGDYSTAHKVADSYIKTAESFIESGAKWIHMVDLDGAKSGTPENMNIFKEIAALGVKVELGGGIRSMETAEKYIEAGISRVIFGSAALRDENLVKKAAEKFGKRIAVGIDAKNRKVSVSGWTEDSDIDFIDMAKKMEAIGIENIIFTDISKDGMLSGPNFDQLNEINQAVSCNIIASGGIRNADDIRRLVDMGLYGAICGKSVYEGTLNISDAVNIGGIQDD